MLSEDDVDETVAASAAGGQAKPPLAPADLTEVRALFTLARRTMSARSRTT